MSTDTTAPAAPADRTPATATGLGTADWTRRTGGRLSRRERRELLQPLLRSLLGNVAGRARMAVGLHPGRGARVDPAALMPPSSALTGEAAATATELLTPALLHHSHRTYAWGAALGAIEGVRFDRELLYVAALLHDTGLMNVVPGVDFTVRSADVAAAVTAAHDVGGGAQQTIADAICLHHTPGITLAHGPEAYLLSAGAAVDVFGLRSWELPDQVRAGVVDDWPRVGFKREFGAWVRAEAACVPCGRMWYLRRYAASAVSIPFAPFSE